MGIEHINEISAFDCYKAGNINTCMKLLMCISLTKCMGTTAICGSITYYSQRRRKDFLYLWLNTSININYLVDISTTVFFYSHPMRYYMATRYPSNHNVLYD